MSDRRQVVPFRSQQATLAPPRGSLAALAADMTDEEIEQLVAKLRAEAAAADEHGEELERYAEHRRDRDSAP